MSPRPGSPREWARATAAVLLLAGVTLVVIALASRRSSGSDHAGAPAPPLTTPADAGGRHPIVGIGQTRAALTLPGGQTFEWCLMQARTEAQQHQGLMGVTDPALGGFDGMLFSFAEPTDTSFWMKDTPMPLSIAFFDASGRFVSATDMAACGDSDACPTYAASRSYASAIEVPQGRLAALGIGAGSSLRTGPGPCGVTPAAARPA